MSDAKVHCAVCKNYIDLANSHIVLTAEEDGELRDVKPRHDDYYLHYNCWDSLAGGWMDPA